LNWARNMSMLLKRAVCRPRSGRVSSRISGGKEVDVRGQRLRKGAMC
jgi:hypothetical protein